MAAAVVVDNVTKRFKLANHKTFKQLTVNAVKGRELTRSFTALEGVSLHVEEGEQVGLMGLNGSGKSTLLKLIAGVMKPDVGTVRTRGRVAGLIDVGAGLHPELTGRENIYLSGAILGMSEAEITRKFDRIVDFSEMEAFLDTETRQYSSGMFMKLAFSVAVHTDCDVFLIDEVLAVGDQPFRRKCMNLIRAFKEEGRTMVFVSHNPKQVINLCQRGLVLQKGKLAYAGSAPDAVTALGYVLDDVDDEDVAVGGR
jgi:ABC-2 type transport system ATP-binding protein